MQHGINGVASSLRTKRYAAQHADGMGSRKGAVDIVAPQQDEELICAAPRNTGGLSSSWREPIASAATLNTPRPVLNSAEALNPIVVCPALKAKVFPVSAFRSMLPNSIFPVRPLGKRLVFENGIQDVMVGRSADVHRDRTSRCHDRLIKLEFRAADWDDNRAGYFLLQEC